MTLELAQSQTARHLEGLRPPLGSRKAEEQIRLSRMSVRDIAPRTCRGREVEREGGNLDVELGLVGLELAHEAPGSRSERQRPIAQLTRRTMTRRGSADRGMTLERAREVLRRLRLRAVAVCLTWVSTDASCTDDDASFIHCSRRCFSLTSDFVPICPAPPSTQHGFMSDCTRANPCCVPPATISPESSVGLVAPYATSVPGVW